MQGLPESRHTNQSIAQVHLVETWSAQEYLNPGLHLNMVNWGENIVMNELMK